MAELLNSTSFLIGIDILLLAIIVLLAIYLIRLKRNYKKNLDELEGKKRQRDFFGDQRN